MGVAEEHGQAIAVLIIDDELSLAQSLAAGLQAAQIRALVADSALDALRLLAERPDIGVVVTDVRMPDYDGLDLAQRVMSERREEEALEVIVISGHATMETAATAVSTRVSALLYKPFRLAAMIKAVNTAMEMALKRRAAVRERSESSAQLAALEAERRQLLEWLTQARERLAALPEEFSVARAVRQEVAAISQTLQTPMAAAAGAEAVAAAGGSGDDAFLRSLREGVERSVGTVSLLEELCGLHETLPEMPDGPVGIAECFDRVHRFRAPELREKALVLEEGAWSAPAVLATPRALERTLDRGLQAAIECAPEGSRIRVIGRGEERDDGAWSVLDLVADPPEGAAGRCEMARVADDEISSDCPHGSLAFQIARRRARALGGEFGVHCGQGGAFDPHRGDGPMTFRLALPAAPIR